MQAMALIYVMTGGAIGSAMRYLAMSFIGRLSVDNFPYATLTVNILGSFLMGVWIAIMANWLPDRAKDLHLLFAVGMLGGFTTLSTFSSDVFYLFERGAHIQAVGYILGSVVLSVLSLVLGIWIVKVLV